MTDRVFITLLSLLVCVAAPLLGIAMVAGRGHLTWQRAILAAALSEIPVAWAAAALISLFAECVGGPCPEVSLWEQVRWWLVVGGIGALDGAAVAVVALSLRLAVHRVRRAA
jgi:hypothetical protein